MSDAISLFVSSRFNGPPGMGNGGFSAGLAAQLIDGPAEVSLRASVPLDTPLSLVPTQGEHAYECRQGDQIVMTASRAAPLAPLPSPPPSLAIARKGRDHYPPVETHAFPACFVCGPARTDDGLCIFTGQPDGFDGVADTWTPSEAFADETGQITREVLWAALDCPGAFAIGFEDRPMVLARIIAEIHARPRAGEEVIVAAWHLYDEGRKHGAATGLFAADGTLLAQSEQLWIDLKPPVTAA